MFKNLGVFSLIVSFLIVILIKEKNPFVHGLISDNLDNHNHGFENFENEQDTYQNNMNKENDHCPNVKPMTNFNIFAMLGAWYIVQYYSSLEEALTYKCMRADFELTNGNMDMRMKLNYKYAFDPNGEIQSGKMIFQIPNPMRPEQWRHSEDHYKGIYYTDVIDTDYNKYLLLLHCSEPESNTKFLSTFILSRGPQLDLLTTNYLRDKVENFAVDPEYIFPVDQTNCTIQEIDEKIE